MSEGNHQENVWVSFPLPSPIKAYTDSVGSFWALHGEGWSSQQQNHKKRKPRQLVTPKSQASPAAAAFKQSFMASPRGRVQGQELSCQLSAKAWMTEPQSPREQCWATVIKNMRYRNDAVTKPHFVKSTCTNKNLKEYWMHQSELLRSTISHQEAAFFKALFTGIQHSPCEAVGRRGQNVLFTPEIETHGWLSPWSLVTSTCKPCMC